MRLHFTLSPNEQPVPFAYQHHLVGAFHKWLGSDNELHDRVSLYSLSWLDNGRMVRNGFEFSRGAHWFISLHDESLIEHIVNQALAQPEVCFGMRVTRIEQQATPHFGTYQAFKVGSPVLARSKEVDGKVKHLIYSDLETDEVLTTTLRHKMDKADIADAHKNARVRFDRSYRGAKTKLVRIKEIESRASICPVIVEGTPEAVQFAWNVGVGHSTGSGFGCLL
jgi:CRISPR-associated endoribonuclease Cas6